MVAVGALDGHVSCGCRERGARAAVSRLVSPARRVSRLPAGAKRQTDGRAGLSGPARLVPRVGDCPPPHAREEAGGGPAGGEWQQEISEPRWKTAGGSLAAR